ncbi:TPA: alpha/beta hydrolase [Pseudomonas aeruginosa]|uniref:Alpha/beta fold hydrolase n=1 Tax=Pseudomonas aeruginosa TaxID=287 RepID=A0A7M3B4L7_PSEAI|nr:MULTISPECIES: alpha/beta hydrolase [Pseudomonas]EAZ58782.1 hypothetical protein PA2G_02036 [Pseudomonas aeruginosa 2192]AVN42040.1 alpha/beta hydrolase [Pseudomonas aeruginosa]AVZ19029.1 alpha/beta hydrolase [Pseudomonas aeruginosa]AXL83057.1 alpha/beta hydrolase [Pseudomonas aeruginosa]AXO28496.1 Putative hydrolase or acyltransferase of alpha/beta superfamily [Pseudomonas aeruginosa]
MRDLVLLHGGQHGSWCWEPLIEVLAETTPAFERVITLDMPGCGRKRSRDPSRLALADIARELNDELHDQGVSQAVLLGHSIAGVVLPLMAAQAPSLFSRLLYLSTAIPLEGQTIMQMLGTSRHGADPEHVGWPVDITSTSPEALAVAMFGRDLDERQLAWLLKEASQERTPPATQFEPASRAGYAELDIPATFILTLRDDILPVPWQRLFAERLGCAEIIEIDTPHEPFVSHPHILAEVLRHIR